MERILGWSSLAVAVALSGTARAQECETDDDCDEGFVCQDLGTKPCATVDCPPDAECPEPEPCDEETYYGCVPAPCESDDECGDGLICLSVSYELCTGTTRPDCPPDEDCAVPDEAESTEPECETHEESYCAPPYAAPCTEDADCGDGFTCVESESCWCSGGAGTPSSGGGSDGSDGEEPAPSDTPADEDCGCEGTGEYYCEIIEMECTEDSECPSDWTCEESGASSGSCTFDSETGEEECTVDDAESTSYCVPPHWDQGWSRSSGGGYEALADATGSAAASPTAPSPEDGDDSASAGGGGGCAVSDAAGRSAFAWMMILAALGWVVRRRK